ncbi:MAG: glutamine synthetase family protein [Campylobacterota bacterium]|nr:glutamine synthetase family protein [Campylobacterota bacterium]
MKKTLEYLRHNGVKFIRVLWCDNANIIRAKSIHIEYLENILKDGIKIAKGQMAIPVMYDVVVPSTGLSAVGEVTLVPDTDTLKILPFAKGQASMMGDMKILGSLDPWDNCPREYLKRQIGRLSQQGITIKSVFENEFYLLSRDGDGELVRSDNTLFAMTGFANRHADFLLDLEDALERQNLKVESYYSESGQGQQEFNIRYSDALASADNQITYRETVRAVASKYGFIASFMPKIFEDSGGSGTHLNFSLWSGAANISGDEDSKNGISEISSYFLAGILQHLKALCGVTIPSINSYRRIMPHYWAGAYTSWGYYNREASIRVSKNSAQTKAQRFELKVNDASSNPYLALGALIACGLDGIANKMSLPDETTIDPAYASRDECSAKGIERLPQSLGEALECLHTDSVILDSMGEALANSFYEVRKYEWKNLKDSSLEEEVEIMLERY